MVLPKSVLIHGAYYAGHCRNASVARWNRERNVFLYRRHKFGHTFIEEISHPDDDQVYDVFVPEQIIADPDPDNPIPLDI